MNMQMIMQQAKKMQAQLQKDQEELEKTEYEGKSSVVDITINGKYEVLKVNFDIDEEDMKTVDKEMLEDMVMVAFNDAVKKASTDKENKMSKYGQGLPGLF